MKTQGIALSLVLCASAAGCATITRGTAQDFTVQSTPAGASVRTSNGFECASTPCTFHMPRKNAFTVDVHLEGYEPATLTVASHMSGGGTAGLAGNIIAGGLIGIGVDASSGALNDLTPNPLQVALVPVVTAAPTPVPAPVADGAAVANAAVATAAPPAATPTTAATSQPN